jgi:hypothetical protein
METIDTEYVGRHRRNEVCRHGVPYPCGICHLPHDPNTEADG